MDSFPFKEESLMHRFYADPVLSDERHFFLDAEDTVHAVKVLRMQQGDRAEIISGGQRFLATVESTTGDRTEFLPVSLLPSTEPAVSFTLFQGLPKGDKMDWIVQKATELGAVRIVPVSFSRCIVRLTAKDAQKKQARWQKIARESGKQSGRCRIPEVTLPVSVSDMRDLFSSLDQVAVPWEECPEGGPLSFIDRHPSVSSLGIVIGPEGGISPEEITVLTGSRAEPVTLGKRILRTETAGLAALSVFSALYGEME